MLFQVIENNVDIKIKIDTKRLERDLRKIQANAKDLKQPMQTTSHIMADDIQKHFAQAVDDKGRRWEKRKSNAGTHSLLQKSGRLKSSLDRGTGTTFGRSWAKVASNVVYSAAQNYGYPPRNLPKRTFMYLSKYAKKTIIAWLKKAILKT